MSDAKTPKKPETVAKQSQSAAPAVTSPASGKVETVTTDTPKTEAAKTDQSKPEPNTPEATASDSPAASASELASAPKSASQASISHFSSVSTPEYRSGWNKIFETGSAAAPVQPSDDAKPALPADFFLSDAQISSALRANLVEAFQHLTDAQGISLSETQASAKVTYNIACRVAVK